MKKVPKKNCIGYDFKDNSIFLYILKPNHEKYENTLNNPWHVVIKSYKFCRI